MKRVRCHDCKCLDRPKWFTPFNLAHKGHTRRIYICDECISTMVTMRFKHKLTKREKREHHIEVLKHDREIERNLRGL